MEIRTVYSTVLGVAIATWMAFGLITWLIPLIYNRFLAIKERRQSIADQIADQEAIQRSYKSLWHEANHLMCALPTAQSIVTEVGLRTLYLPQPNINYYMQRAEQCSTDIHRIQTRLGRLQKRALAHPSDLPFTANQVDELKKLTTRMKARLRDIESLYRKIDRHLQESREKNVNLPR